MLCFIKCADGKTRLFQKTLLLGRAVYLDRRGFQPHDYKAVKAALDVTAEIQREFACGGRGRFWK